MRKNLFRRFLRGSWGKIFLLSFLGMATSFCGVYLALLSKQVVDIATSQAQGSLLQCGIWLGAFIILQLLLQILLNMLDVRIVVPMRFRIQSKLFGECLHKQKLSLDRFHSGELVNRIAGDTSIVAEGVVSIIPSVVSILARIIFSFCALLVLDPILAVLCLVAGVFMLVAAQIYRKKAGALFRKSREAEGKIRSLVQEVVQNIVVIKAFSVQSVVKRQLGYTQDNAYDLAIRKTQLSIIANVCFYVAMTAGYYLALGWGAWRLLHGLMSFGTLTAILALTGEVAGPFQSLARLFPQYVSVCTSVERLDELDALPEDEETEQIKTDGIYQTLQEIAISNVSFSYGDAEVLRDVTVSFPKNTMTAVMGESGVGKSTLLNLLVGILVPASGEISLRTENGVFPLGNQYSGMFAYVPQDFMLLTGDVLENITLFDENPDMERFEQAISVAEVESVLAELPQGMHTQLGEGGGRLSGGQRQRMALARALYTGADILLLDEATSALSADIEEKILKKLRDSGKTVIFVTHRQGAAELCDRVLNVEDGILTQIR